MDIISSFKKKVSGKGLSVVFPEGSDEWGALGNAAEVDPISGDVLAAYGSGERGSSDGNGLEAAFDAPQGLALGDGTLFVADTDNHRVQRMEVEGMR